MATSRARLHLNGTASASMACAADKTSANTLLYTLQSNPASSDHWFSAWSEATKTQPGNQSQLQWQRQ